jgi:ABC-type glycerol-3-phosphate transport system substrate-binding protein
MRVQLLMLLGLGLTLSACAAFQPAQKTQPADLKPTSAAPQTTTKAPLPTQTQALNPSDEITLRLWVPPQFDSASKSRAGILLLSRLEEFTKRRPGVHIEVRVKATSGNGGLLDSLVTTSAAAPLALPDLIALPRPALEVAVARGLVRPLNDLTRIMEEPGWFEYAQELASIQDNIYGLPYAGDALVLVYRSSALSAPPKDWSSSLKIGVPLVFPAADPQAMLTLTLYRASGGGLSDQQGRLAINTEILSRVYSFYAQAEQTGLMPYWLSQYQNDNQVWQAFMEQRADQVVTWTRQYLSGAPRDSSLAALPTPTGEPFTLATGWVWAMVTHQPERQKAAAELAEFLVDSDFLAIWTQAVGYLPPRQDALDRWSDPVLKASLQKVAESAQLAPSEDRLANLNDALMQATIQVLKKQSDPLTAAQSVSKSLPTP